MMKRNLKLKFIWCVVLLMGLSFFSEAQITLTIEQALDIAEDNNPSLQSAKLNYERTQYLLEATRIGLKPQFSMSVNPFGYSQTRSFDAYNAAWYTRREMGSSGTFQSVMTFLPTDATLRLSNTFGWQDSEAQKSTGTTINKAFSNDLSLRLNQPLFTYNQTKMQIQTLQFDIENAGINYALQRLGTERNITRQFYSVYYAKERLEIRRADLENSQRNYDIIKEKVEADLSPRSELFQAEVNLANAQSALQQSEVSLQDAKDNLKQILGMPLNEDVDVLVTIDAKPILIDIDKAIHSGLSSRMELRQREINMVEADLRMIVEKARDEFRGDLSLSIGITGDNENFGNIYETPTQSPRIAISFNVPIFDWGLRKTRIQAQKTAQTIAKLNYDNEVVDIELNIRSTVRSLENLLLQIDIAEITVRNAQQTYDLSEIQYREGDINGLQLSQYQSQLSSAKTSIVSAQINYKNELLNLKILTLYDFENDKPIVPVRELLNSSKK